MSKVKDGVKRTEKENTATDSGGGSDSGRPADSSNTVTLSEESKQDLADFLMPKIQKYIDESVNEKFKKLEPSRETVGQTTGSVIMSPGSAASTPAATPDISSIVSEIGSMINGKPVQWGNDPKYSMQQQPAGQQPNPLGMLGQNPMMLMELLKMLGVGQQQGMGFSPELMMRMFYEDVAFMSYLKRAAVARLFKDPAMVQEFGSISDTFVGDPMKKTANIMSGKEGQQ